MQNFLPEYFDFLDNEIQKAKKKIGKISDSWQITKCRKKIDEDILNGIIATKDGIYWLENIQDKNIPFYLRDNIRYFMRLKGYKPLYNS